MQVGIWNDKVARYLRVYLSNAEYKKLRLSVGAKRGQVLYLGVAAVVGTTFCLQALAKAGPYEIKAAGRLKGMHTPLGWWGADVHLGVYAKSYCSVPMQDTPCTTPSGRSDLLTVKLPDGCVRSRNTEGDPAPAATAFVKKRITSRTQMVKKTPKKKIVTLPEESKPQGRELHDAVWKWFEWQDDRVRDTLVSFMDRRAGLRGTVYLPETIEDVRNYDRMIRAFPGMLIVLAGLADEDARWKPLTDSWGRLRSIDTQNALDKVLRGESLPDDAAPPRQDHDDKFDARANEILDGMSAAGEPRFETDDRHPRNVGDELDIMPFARRELHAVRDSLRGGYRDEDLRHDIERLVVRANQCLALAAASGWELRLRTGVDTSGDEPRTRLIAELSREIR